mgnify:CR=1 FL=1
MKPIRLNKTQRELLSRFLDELDEYQSRSSCNDMTLPNTDEMWKELVMAEKHIDGRKKLKRPQGPTLRTCDGVILDYLRRLMDL